MDSEPKLDLAIGVCEDIADEGEDEPAITWAEALGGVIVGAGVEVVLSAAEIEDIRRAISGLAVLLLLLMDVLVTLMSFPQDLLNRAAASTAGSFVGCEVDVVVVGKME